MGKIKFVQNFLEESESDRWKTRRSGQYKIGLQTDGHGEPRRDLWATIVMFPNMLEDKQHTSRLCAPNNIFVCNHDNDWYGYFMRLFGTDQFQ